MEYKQHRKKFTPEEIDVLAANPFTSKVDFYHIQFTLEFQNIFLARYEAGESSMEIFIDLGYDPAILGNNRIYNYYRQLKTRLDRGQSLTERSGNARIQKPANTDYNTMPSQQSVAAMQRELAYLRQQLEFLKKITSLDKDGKPRN